MVNSETIDGIWKVINGKAVWVNTTKTDCEAMVIRTCEVPDLPREEHHRDVQEAFMAALENVRKIKDLLMAESPPPNVIEDLPYFRVNNARLETASALVALLQKYVEHLGSATDAAKVVRKAIEVPLGCMRAMTSEAQNKYNCGIDVWERLCDNSCTFKRGPEQQEISRWFLPFDLELYSCHQLKSPFEERFGEYSDVIKLLEDIRERKYSFSEYLKKYHPTSGTVEGDYNAFVVAIAGDIDAAVKHRWVLPSNGSAFEAAVKLSNEVQQSFSQPRCTCSLLATP